MFSAALTYAFKYSDREMMGVFLFVGCFFGCITVQIDVNFYLLFMLIIAYYLTIWCHEVMI